MNATLRTNSNNHRYAAMALTRQEKPLHHPSSSTRFKILFGLICLVVPFVLSACGGEQNVSKEDSTYLFPGETLSASVLSADSSNATGSNNYSRTAASPTADMESDSFIEEPSPSQTDNNSTAEFNPIVDTTIDSVSTFGLDVDTGSYVLARNYLNAGTFPPANTVRVEEFINYFDAGYTIPNDVFGLFIEAAPSPFAADSDLLIRVGVQAPNQMTDIDLPNSLVLVIDRSGSMDSITGSGREILLKYELGLEAVALLTSSLPETTRIGVVVYDDIADMVLQPSEIGTRDISSELKPHIQPNGSTNAAAGLYQGYQMALAEAEAGHSVLVMLISDGVANVGATQTEDILEQIGERSDISLTTIGVGFGEFNDRLMEQLSNRADGTYKYIDTVTEAKRVFVDDFKSLLTVAAGDAKIQVEFDPEAVASWRLLGFENRFVSDEDFRNDSVDAGEIGLGQTSTALYEITPTDTFFDIATPALATLRYLHPITGEATEISAVLATIYDTFEAAPLRFQLVAVAAEFAEILRASPYAEQSNLSILRDSADRVAASLDDGDADELARLIQASADGK